MKCPYQKQIIHIDTTVNAYVVSHTMDVEQFSDCLKYECPFYRSEKEGYTGENCARADSECGRYSECNIDAVIKELEEDKNILNSNNEREIGYRKAVDRAIRLIKGGIG